MAMSEAAAWASSMEGYTVPVSLWAQSPLLLPPSLPPSPPSSPCDSLTRPLGLFTEDMFFFLLSPAAKQKLCPFSPSLSLAHSFTPRLSLPPSLPPPAPAPAQSVPRLCASFPPRGAGLGWAQGESIGGCRLFGSEARGILLLSASLRHSLPPCFHAPPLLIIDSPSAPADRSLWNAHGRARVLSLCLSPSRSLCPFCFLFLPSSSFTSRAKKR